MRRTVYATDWSHTGDPTIDTFKDAMEANIPKQDDPSVGIFWYDTKNSELFGVRQADVNDVEYYKSNLFDNKEVKTCTPLHYKVWEREFYKGRDKRFRGDYTQIPRGRIFYVKDRGFVVVVGHWINDYPACKDEVIYEFQLPENQTEFMIDEHWDLGHGWSDKLM